MKDLEKSGAEPAGAEPGATVFPSFRERLDQAIDRSRDYLLSRQDPEGFWVDELESNVTITAELVFFMHFMDLKDRWPMDKFAAYLLKTQREDGSWPLFYEGPCDINCTVESYMALKLAGYAPDHPAMVKAREAVFAHGGIQRTRVFTRIFLAMFGQVPWDTPPAVPVELVLFPDHFGFNIYEMSSWSRGTVVPLSVIYAHRPVYPLAPGNDFRELFTEADRDLDLKAEGPPFLTWRDTFVYLDRFIKFLGTSPWKPLRKKALRKAEEWILTHQEKEGDFAGIQPAMLNSLLALHYLGYPNDHPALVKGLEAIDRFLIDDGDSLRMQACVSPLWDTAIAGNALLDSGMPSDHPALVRAGEWILKRQVTTRGDWAVKNPEGSPGGWPFEFYNEQYPDTDDTAEILIFLERLSLPDVRGNLRGSEQALQWVLSMQSSNGGWAAFDRDNTLEVLNEVPFADHKAMLDPPTVDVTGRILWCLGLKGFKPQHPRAARALEFVKSHQEEDGCWWGRWGVNYIYGTFLVLHGLRAMGEAMNQASIRRAVEWLESRQNEDGGWGETCASYEEPSLRGRGPSTYSQTAWALLGLLAAGEATSPAVERGVGFLLRHQDETGTWWEDFFTGTGFPGHFFIKYHMYEHHFPLMALSRYRNAIQGKKNV